MHIDLHTHTLASDGKLSASELIQRAVTSGVDMLSITDHDTVAAYREMPDTRNKLTLIPGIEFSTGWRNTGIHVVGLNINLKSAALEKGITRQQEARRQRAEHIAARLAKLGVRDALAGAQRIAGHGNNIGRPHFAEHLVNIGAARSCNHAFDKFLKAGVCDSTGYWATLPQIISWIRDAGGIAVLAHPLKYRFTRTKFSALLDDFMEAGGLGVEVISGKQNSRDTGELAELCARRQLLASCGSDFHQPGQPWAEVGNFQQLPKGSRPVWEHF
ncbi:MAG: PHP domain-containing protein [Gammaproteobacteria bacterium]